MGKLVSIYTRDEDAELLKRAKAKAAAERRTFSASVLRLLEAWVNEKGAPTSAASDDAYDLDDGELEVLDEEL